MKRTLDAFFATKSSEELMQAAVERKLLLAPVLEILFGDLRRVEHRRQKLAHDPQPAQERGGGDRPPQGQS